MPKTSEIGNGEQTTESHIDPETSPDVKVKEAKMVIFRSKDRELTLVQKAGYTEKSHGTSSYVQTKSVQFVDFIFMIADVTENKKTISWLRKHPSNGLSFREVPWGDSEGVIKPSIEELEKMSMKELRELCDRYELEIREGASREAIILTILKK